MRRRCLNILAFLLVAAALTTGAHAEPASPYTSHAEPASPYTFVVNGTAFEPRGLSVRGAEDLTAGDFVCIGDYWVQVGEPGRYAYRVDIKKGHLFALEEAGKPSGAEGGAGGGAGAEGEGKLIGASVMKLFEEHEFVPVDGLSGLSADAIQGLRSVVIEHPDGKAAARLPELSPDCAVHLGGVMAMGSIAALPRMSDRLRFLFISNVNQEIRSYDRLNELAGLEVLDVFERSGVRIDLKGLRCTASLRYLAVWGLELENLSALGACRQLQSLSLWSRELDDLSFVRGLTSLVRLGVGGTHVADVSPLAACKSLCDLDVNETGVTDLSGLAGCPALRRVSARSAPVQSLPTEGAAALQYLNVVGSHVDPARVAAFQRTHPACRFLYGYTQSLQETLATTTRVRIRSGGTCHRVPAEERTLVELTDPKAIREFMAMLTVGEGGVGHCMCCGNPTFEFYNKDRLLASVGFHHGVTLRWSEGWPEDAALTPAVCDPLVNWLAAHGAAGPLEEREAAVQEGQAQQRRETEATRGMSPALKRAVENDTFDTVIAKEMPNPSQRARFLLRILGLSNGVWSERDPFDSEACGALEKVKPSVQQAAVRSALLGSDRMVRRGAARFWVGYESPLARWLPPVKARLQILDKEARAPLADWKPRDEARLRRIVLDVEQEARCVPLRQAALAHVREWVSLLTSAEVTRRLDIGLHDPDADVRRQALLEAARLRHTASLGSIKAVLLGKAVVCRALPPVSAAEQQDVARGREPVAGDAPEWQVAALALGWMDCREAVGAIRGRPACAAREVALAMLGEPQRLRREYFRTQSMECQRAAIEAVRRCQGAVGLAWAVNYRRAQWWCEDDLVLDSLREMLLAAGAPGRIQLEKVKDLDGLRAWYAKHGEAYLARIRQRRGPGGGRR